MTEFITVFEVSRWSNGVLANLLFDLLIGLVSLLIGATGLVLVWRKSKGWARGRAIPFLFIMAWGVLWAYDLPRMFQWIHGLTEAYAQGRYEVAEGVVTVLHQQPAHGHSSGDRIVVGGKAFEVSYYYATPAYRQTIAHGGVLRAGAYARLGHVGGEIVRVDIRK